MLAHTPLLTPQLVCCVRKASTASTRYVMDKVKKHDYETYLCLLLSSSKWRYPAFILHAFNIELSLAMDTVTDSRAAAGRFAFWRDAVDSMYCGGRPYDHPVSIELHRLYNSGMLESPSSQKWLTQMVAARDRLSMVSHIDTIDNLELYAEQTRSSVLYLTLAFTGTHDITADHAASHLGKCQGLLTALRATPYLLTKNQIHIPQDVLSKFSVSQSDVLRAKDNVKEPAFELASMANTHLEKSKSLMDKIPKEAKLVFLPSVIYGRVLEKLRQSDFNLFDSSLHKKNSFLSWQLWRGSKKLS